MVVRVGVRLGSAEHMLDSTGGHGEVWLRLCLGDGHKVPLLLNLRS